MCNPFAELWWLVAVRGLAGLALAALALVWPWLTLEAIIFGFGVYAIADGALALWAGVQRHRDGYTFWPFGVEGALGILFGAAVLAVPDAVALSVWYLIAAWALGTGVFEVIVAARVRRYYAGEMLMGMAGVASAALGIVMLVWPRGAMLALAWLVGIYAALFGILLLVLAARLRRLLHAAEPSHAPRSIGLA